MNFKSFLKMFITNNNNDIIHNIWCALVKISHQLIKNLIFDKKSKSIFDCIINMYLK